MYLRTFDRPTRKHTAYRSLKTHEPGMVVWALFPCCRPTLGLCLPVVSIEHRRGDTPTTRLWDKAMNPIPPVLGASDESRPNQVPRGCRPKIGSRGYWL